MQNSANESEGFDPPKIDANKREEILSNVYELPAKLEKAREALVMEARRHLGFPALTDGHRP